MEISLEDAFKGTTASFPVLTKEQCSRCGGDGTVASPGGKVCSACGGTGKVKAVWGSSETMFAHSAMVTGQNREICPECRGEGFVSKNKKLSDVKIPAGVRDGQRIRLAKQGATVVIST